MPSAVLFQSGARHEAFRKALTAAGADVVELDFADPAWRAHDFSGTDAVIYYPSFQFSSNHPQALTYVKDDLAHLARRHPELAIYPDPGLLPYYSDKYRQMLFLEAEGFATPRTWGLTTAAQLDRIEAATEYPLVAKNRFGAGGDFVWRVSHRKELETLRRLAVMDHFGFRQFVWRLRRLLRRESLYWLIKRRRAAYPLPSSPLIVQEYVEHSRDLKIVVGEGRIFEMHWRRNENHDSWKMNIDSGGEGEWSHVPDEARQCALDLAHRLQARWLNVDLIESQGRFLISEFSPVWHHYRYMEKENFVYKDDYNADVPLEEAFDLETAIVASLLRADVS